MQRGGLKKEHNATHNDISIIVHNPQDVLEQADALPSWSQDYIQLDKGSFAGNILSVSCGETQIFRESMNRSVDEHASPPENSYVIGIATLNEGEGLWQGGHIEKDALISIDKNRELQFKTSHNSEINVAVINDSYLEEYAAEVEHVNLRDLFSKINPVEQLPQAIQQELNTALTVGSNYISEQGDIIDLPQFWAHMQDNLLHACLNAMQHIDDDVHLRYHDARVHRYMVTTVRNLVLSNSTEPMTIGDICRTLNISRRSLNHAFYKVLGIPPVAYMRNIRLHHIRRELKYSPDTVVSIAHTASKWGFWHMSLFSKYYRELFAELPSATLEKAKNGIE